MFDQFVRVPDAIEFIRKPIFARVLAAIGALIFRARDHLMKAHGYIEDGLAESQTQLPQFRFEQLVISMAYGPF